MFKLGIVTSYRDSLSLFKSIPGDWYDAFLDTYSLNIINSVRSQTGISRLEDEQYFDVPRLIHYMFPVLLLRPVATVLRDE